MTWHCFGEGLAEVSAHELSRHLVPSPIALTKMSRSIVLANNPSIALKNHSSSSTNFQSAPQMMGSEYPNTHHQ